MHTVMSGQATPAALAGLLAALAMKGEQPHEIVGFARTMRAHAVKLSAPAGPVFDTCGTGGDRAGTFNISSAAALVVAATGVRVAKHGNRSVSSRCGSADVFEALGVHVAAEPAVVERTLHEAGVAFFFAPTFHPVDEARGADPPRSGDPQRLQPAGPADQPGGCGASDYRRAEARADRARGQGAGAAGVGAGVGRARRGRPRRAVHDRLHQGVGMPRRRGAHLLPAPGRFRRRRRRRPRIWPAATRRRTPASCAACSMAGRDPARDVVVFNAGAALLVAGRWHRFPTGCAPPKRRSTPARRGRRSIGWCVLSGRSARHEHSGPAGRHRRRHAARRADAARAANRMPPWPGGRKRPQPRGALFEARLRALRRGEHHRRVQAAVAVEGRAGPLLRSGGDRAGLRSAAARRRSRS